MTAYTLEELAKITDSKLIGDPNYEITGVNDLEIAQLNEAAFLENSRYERLIKASHAGVIIITSHIKHEPNTNYLINETPSLAFQAVIELFLKSPKSGFSNIHPSAIIHEKAEIGKHVTIGPHVVVDCGARIGDHTVIAPNVTIGAEALIGNNCHIYPHVVIREGCEIGDRVILQPGVVVGSCGFGYFTTKDGQHIKLKQLGKVVVEDDVEIGANSTIDRARFKTTRIGKGSKLDNLVQIAHQVEVGSHTIMASQVGVAGSTKIGNHVVMGGQVGIAGHLSIVSGAVLAARSAVSKNITQSILHMGVPAAPFDEFKKQFVQQRSVGKWIQRVKNLEVQVSQITSNINS